MSRGETDIQSAASLFAFLYGASLVGAATGFAGRRPRGGRKDGRIGRKQHGFLSDRGGLRYRRSSPETAAKVSPLRPGSVSEPAVQEQHTPDPQPVRSKNTGSCFRFVSSCSRVQRSGVHRHHRRWQGARPMRYRTDRGKSKRDRFLAASQNGRRRKAFSPFKGLHSVERKRKRNFLPTGEVRPSEHDTDF